MQAKNPKNQKFFVVYLLSICYNGGGSFPGIAKTLPDVTVMGLSGGQEPYRTQKIIGLTFIYTA